MRTSLTAVPTRLAEELTIPENAVRRTKGADRPMLSASRPSSIRPRTLFCSGGLEFQALKNHVVHREARGPPYHVAQLPVPEVQRISSQSGFIVRHITRRGGNPRG